jgi:PAS domain S-box-containing protein
MHITFANFAFNYLKNMRLAHVYLDRTRPLKTAVDDRFFLFRKDSELRQQQQSQSLGGEEWMDLVSYIEFQNNFRQARRFHKKALKQIRGFWRMLLSDNVDIAELPTAFKFIGMAETKARNYYLQLVRKYPNSARVLRAYGEFLDEVMNDHFSADMLYYKAEMAEENKSKVEPTKEDVSDEETDDGAYITSHSAVNSNQFMVMIDTKGMIKDVNKNCRLFGYTQSDLLDKKLNILIPEPYRTPHDDFIFRHLSSGVTKIIGMGRRRLPIVNKDQTISAILLSVTKVSVGSELMFVGLITKVKEGLIGTDRDGNILYVSNTVRPIIGWNPKDLEGKNIATFLDPSAPNPLIVWKDNSATISSSGSGTLHCLLPDGQPCSPLSVEISISVVEGMTVCTIWIIPSEDQVNLIDAEGSQEEKDETMSVVSADRSTTREDHPRSRRKLRRMRRTKKEKVKLFNRKAIAKLTKIMRFVIISIFVLRFLSFLSG